MLHPDAVAVSPCLWLYDMRNVRISTLFGGYCTIGDGFCSTFAPVFTNTIKHIDAASSSLYDINSHG